MSDWPPNPYLQEFLRSDEGQAYLAKYGNLEVWKLKHGVEELPSTPAPEEPALDKEWLF